VELKRVCVFCGSNSGRREEYALVAAAAGELLAKSGIELVYGGGHVGLMGQVADAALSQGGKVIGVIPEALVARELAHRGLTELRVVDSMHERKALMAELADGFIALPGGYGTLEEFCEILTWAQLGLHTKPCGLLNVAGYYDDLLRLFDRAAEEEFLPQQHRGWVIQETEIARLLGAMKEFRPPDVPKWINRQET
jgi:uncharacterized protein (TIGR00730 family)